MIIAVFWASLLAICAYSAWRGGRPERRAAAGILLAAILSVVLQRDTIDSWREFQSALCWVDGILLAVLLYLTLWFGKCWTIIATAAQAISVLAHVAKLQHLHLSAVAYSLMESLPSWIVVFALLVGTIARDRRKRRPSQQS